MKNLENMNALDDMVMEAVAGGDGLPTILIRARRLHWGRKKVRLLIPQTISILPSVGHFRSPRTAEAVILLICPVMIRFTRRLQIIGSRYFRTTRMARG